MVMFAARRNARREGDLVEGFNDPVYRFELGRELLPVALVPVLGPSLRQGMSEPALDLAQHVGRRSAHEPLDHLGWRQRPAERGQHLHVEDDRQPFAVDQDPVAVEDHHLGHPCSGCQNAGIGRRPVDGAFRPLCPASPLMRPRDAQAPDN
jgi:hypothetical protein